MREKSEISDYISHCFAPEDALLKDITRRLQQHDEYLSRIQLSAGEGRLLQCLLRMMGAKRVVEIGSLAGYSAVWIARALPEIGQVHAINRDKAHFALLQETLQAYEAQPHQGGRIVPHLGDAKQVLKELSAQAPFDAVFIDADKGGYIHYLDWAEQHLCKGGLVIGDNTLLFGHVLADQYPQEHGAPTKKAWQAMREFNQRLADPARYDGVMIPTMEGLTIARKLF